MPVLCDHATTFECHGAQRCAVCYVDALNLIDGTLLWPSQERPNHFSGNAIARWFVDNHITRMPPTCDGFTFARNNLNPGGALYGYLWVELVLDLDFYMAYMLDIRRCDTTLLSDEITETRQYLFVAVEHVDVARIAWHDQIVRFRDDRFTHGNRLIEGLRWFANQTDLWLAQERNT